LDPETTNVDAWVSGRTLVVDGVGSFRVRVNAPSLESVAVFGYPAVGSPLVANPVGARHCDEDEDLEYEWFRLSGRRRGRRRERRARRHRARVHARNPRTSGAFSR